MHENLVFFLLSVEQKSRVVLQVAHVNFCAEFLHVGMLLDQQPADVREKEPALRVVRVGIGVCELVVHAVVSHPLDDVLLRRERLQED